MGAWTTRIFDDDGASDIRAEYKIMLGYGVEPQEVYEKIRDYFYEDYKGQDDEDVYWLSIALFQWQNGILMDEVKEKALQCIADDSYLERWKDSGEKIYKKRKEVLAELKNKLLYEVNPKKKFPKCPGYYRIKTPWKVGDLLAYRIVTKPHSWDDCVEGKRIEASEKKIWNNYVLLRVVDVIESPVTFLYPELDYTSCAHVMLYDWYGEKIPLLEEISKMEFRPIIIDYWSKSKQIVSGVALEIENIKKEMEHCEIILLGNDKRYYENKPILYKENNGCPIKVPSQFNVSLAMTFALQDGDQVEWQYKKEKM